LAGNNATLLEINVYSLQANTGSFALTGNAPELIKGTFYIFDTTIASFVIAGNNANLDRTRIRRRNILIF